MGIIKSIPKEQDMYSKEEQKIVDYIERKNPRNIEDFSDKIAKIKSAITKKILKSKQYKKQVAQSSKVSKEQNV